MAYQESPSLEVGRVDVASVGYGNSMAKQNLSN